MFSLIVPVRDCPADRLDACVRSFLRLKSKTLDEIIVVDFGSDHPVEVLIADRRVRVLRIESEKWNAAEAANAGVGASRNDIVAKVDPGVVVAAEGGPSLDAAVESCRQAAEIILVRTNDLPEEVDAAVALASPSTELLRWGRPRRRWQQSALSIFPVAIWDMIGGFDPRDRDPDGDFINRVRRSGSKVRRTPAEAFCVFHLWNPSRDVVMDHDAPAENRALTEDKSVLRSLVAPAVATESIQSPNLLAGRRPLVTVALLSKPRNAWEWMLARAIRGFAGQIDNDFEILIANSGPADAAGAALAGLLGPLGPSLAVRVIDVGDASSARARNLLTDEARGRYICAVDDNAIALPGRLADHLRCFEKEAGVHGSHGGWIDVDRVSGAIVLNNGSEATVEALLSAPEKATAHTASLYRRDVLQAIRYDEAIAVGAESDLALRLANLGCRVAHTHTYVTLRQSGGAAHDRATGPSGGPEARQRVRESFANLDMAQPKASQPVDCGDKPTKEQVADLIDRVSTPAPDRPVTFATPRHPRGKPLVSIVIPCFNYGQYVADAVASAKAQTFENIEIIVVEGGSTDGVTPGIVAGLEDGRVRVFFRNGRHRGGSNRNYGIERARGAYICCLDADDQLAPTYIEKAVFLMEHYGYDVVSSAVQQFGHVDSRYGVAEKVDLQVLVNQNQMATCGVFRKAPWQVSGGYQDQGDGTAATHVHDDWQFWVRLAGYGARFFNMERDHLFLYRIHGPSSVSRRPGIHSREWQQRRINELNAELITDAALDRSVALRRIPHRASDPMTNLAPTGVAPAAKSIIVAIPYMVLGGAERLLSTVLKHLAQNGWDISIVTTLPASAANGDSQGWFAPATNRIFHLPKFLKQEQWSDFLDYLVASRRASRLLIAGSTYAYEQLPTLKSRHRNLKVFDLLFNTVGHTASNRQAAEYIDGNIVENAEVRDWLLDHGETPERIATIPSGVSLSSLPAPVDPSFRKSLGAKAGDVIVGFCGRWSPEKNPIGFIEIAERLSENRRLHFVMTGAGQLGDEIARRVAAASGLAGRFHILGNVANVDIVLASLDILALPSTIDGRPVVVLEALASGVPVIASRVGGVPELVSPGTNGELCPPGDVEAFAAAIAMLAADRKKLARYKIGARAFAEKHLDERQMLKRYAQVLGSGKSAGPRPVTPAARASKPGSRRRLEKPGRTRAPAVSGADRSRKTGAP